MLLFAGLFELSFGVNLRNWNSILYENGRIVHSNGEVFNLLEGFFESSERYFLRGIHKSYFVFTDSSPSDVAHSCSSKVNVFHLDKYGHPRDTLYRFRTFLTAESELKGFDYIFFFNANVKFVREVNADILPSAGEGLVCALHPLMSKADNKSYPYERDSGSLAYIPWEAERFTCRAP